MQAPTPDPQTATGAADVRRAFKDVQVALRRLRGRESVVTGGPSLAQMGLLRQLDHHGELPASRLASAAELSPPTVTRMLDDLEAAGHVERVRDTVDRRVVLVRLTPAGRTAHAASEAHFHALWEATFADLPAEELAAGVRVLERIRSAFDAF